MRRALKWILGVVGGVLLLCGLAIFLLMRTFAVEVSEDEVARVRAPDGGLEAVLLERNAGATTSFGYEVHIIPVGGSRGETEVAFLYGTVRNAGAYGANLRWLSSDHLRVEYLETKTSELKRPRVVISGKAVNVSLLPGVLDESAPAGGMLYNLQGKQ